MIRDNPLKALTSSLALPEMLDGEFGIPWSEKPRISVASRACRTGRVLHVGELNRVIIELRLHFCPISTCKVTTYLKARCVK